MMIKFIILTFYKCCNTLALVPVCSNIRRDRSTSDSRFYSSLFSGRSWRRVFSASESVL